MFSSIKSFLPTTVFKAPTFKILSLSALLASASLSPAMAQSQILNFKDADIRAVAEDIAMITGQSFIIDPQVSGKVTIISRTAVPEDDIFDLFLSMLRVNGYTAVPTKTGAYKIMPDTAAIANMQLNTKSSDTQRTGDRLDSRLIRVDYIKPITALDSIKPLLNPQGRAIAHRSNNFILLVDYAANLDRIEAIISDIDKDTRKVKMVNLQNSRAEEMADTITVLRNNQIGDEGHKDVGLTIVPVASSNTLILKASQPVLDEITPIIRELDGYNANKGDIRVVKLKYADAEELKPMLDEVSRSLTNQNTTGQSQSRASNEKVSISFHKGTNTLVINASPDMQKTLESVIRELDIPRAQVMVEAIIVEVFDQAAKELGLQYILSGSDGSDIPFSATNYSNTAPNILASAGALLLDDELGDDDSNNGLNQLRSAAIDSLLGLNGFTAGFAGTSNGTLFGVIVNALEQDLASNILSTPSLMTLDNAEAKLLVGQEIPITTGEALGSNNANPFRTVERKEVGISLLVKPQISDSNDIRLNITQEVSSVSGTVGQSSGEIITNKREISTSVMVHDGEIIVLGGLIQQNESINLDKVPLLGDIPLLGNLFKSESKSFTKSNLMVFLRPKIVRTIEDSRAITNHKYNLVRKEQQLNGKNKKARAAIDVILHEVIGVDAPVSQDTHQSNTQ